MTDAVSRTGTIRYMTKRKTPSQFALRRGRLIQRAREDARMTHAELAAEVGRTRPWVIAAEKGQIEQIFEPQCRALISTLGLNPSEVTEDPSMLGADLLPEASFQARRVARAWDELPPSLQQYLWSQIDAYRKLVEKQPVLAQIMGTPVPLASADGDNDLTPTGGDPTSAL